MHDKIDAFVTLPQELKLAIGKTLTHTDLMNFSQASHAYSKTLQPMLAVRKLLHHVVRAEYQTVAAMLHKNMDLLFKKECVTDCSARTFNEVSAFEYALWALDKHMWHAIIDCIPNDETRKGILIRLMAQYNQLKQNGVTYRLNGNSITEKHFDFENTLIKELQTQVDLTTARNKDISAAPKQWREGVGGAQKLLPMHVVDEYCADRELGRKMPDFSVRHESSRTIYNIPDRKNEYWFAADSQLGSHFAILWTIWDPKGVGYYASDCATEEDDFGLKLVTALFETRTKDFSALPIQLEEQILQTNPYYSQLMKLVNAVDEKRRTFFEDPHYKTSSTLQQAERVAGTLHAFLEREVRLYFSKKSVTTEDYQAFKTRCQAYLGTATPVLKKHRGWEKILLNIVAMILTVGVGYALAAGINIAMNRGRFTFFATDSVQKLAAIEDYINDEVKNTVPLVGF